MDLGHNALPTVMTFVLLGILTWLPFSLFLVSDLFARRLRLSPLKAGWFSNPCLLLKLIVYHLLIEVGCIRFFLIDAQDFGKEALISNFHFTRYACTTINILSIPVTYLALRASNSEKLEFEGYHPETGKEWKGVMKMDQSEVDQTSEDHKTPVV
ncbi:hypothetical protein CRE_24617 [Caenorhabditis remanei]|uniref:Uncharacterized protein n=1 Tax=Caenorhabditis remanei TaxID=31234 RepID=E3MVG5_CAERE|nr:hypothetical protein CRE_24617 [Caenorhabditis remanei]